VRANLNNLSETWELTLIVGSCLVLMIALLVVVRSVLKGNGIYAGLKKAVGIILKNLP